SLQAFRSRDIHTEDIAKLCNAVHCSFLLNGWNEISDSYSEKALLMLRNLERNFPSAGIIVATRAHCILPPLPGATRAKLLSLSRMQRMEYLQQRLANRATELSMQFDGNYVLDALTRTPLFLSEVTTIFLAGGQVPRTKMG